LFDCWKGQANFLVKFQDDAAAVAVTNLVGRKRITFKLDNHEATKKMKEDKQSTITVCFVSSSVSFALFLRSIHFPSCLICKRTIAHKARLRHSPDAPMMTPLSRLSLEVIA
jgi:hypothetical protein